ncbi:hypothetical protein [Flavobacterium geliluteum]|uniref:AraC family transcriptional regulator n=1 Tax=Flavobacterium geliluteum TaxID=2816120 RepID=A0A940XBN3_9FLAO|nr:hypothetical protein [Flavobacterium geliluteum]MBP4139041.1 hypothetical protein [Flavobacterium geliluteum]
MKNLYLNTGGFNAIFTDLKESFDGELTANNNEHNLAIKTKFAQGNISGVSFDKEISFMHFDIVFYNDVTLSIESIQTAPVFFAYCEEGSLTHSFGVSGDKKSIKRQQSGILSNTASINSVLHFESHKRVQFSLIVVPTICEKNENSVFISQLKKMFTNESGNYIYLGAENAKISMKMKELKTVSEKRIARGLLKKKQILKSIIEMEIAQHSYNYLKVLDPIMNLATRQITEIKKLSHFNLQEAISSSRLVSKNYFPRIFKEKQLFSIHKLYSQKLAS